MDHAPLAAPSQAQRADDLCAWVARSLREIPQIRDLLAADQRGELGKCYDVRYELADEDEPRAYRTLHLMDETPAAWAARKVASIEARGNPKRVTAIHVVPMRGGVETTYLVRAR